MKLSREKIQRMIEGTGGTGGGSSEGDSLDFQAWANGSFLSLKNGGTVLGDTEFKGALTLNQENVATQKWTDDNYVSIAFFRTLFRAYNAAGNAEITPNHTDLAGSIDNIKAMFGFWTESYISALGRGNGQATSVNVLNDLADVTISSPQNNQVLIYNSATSKWINGSVPSGTVTSIGMQVPTGFAVTPGSITQSGTFKITFASGYSLPTTAKQANWDTAYTNNHTHSNKSVLDGITSALITNWNAAYTKATTLEGYFDGNGNAKSALKLTTVSKTAWGQTYWTSGGVPTDISGNMTSVGDITMDGSSNHRINPNGSSLYIGNSNNSGWVYMADMCSQDNSSNWKIPASGNAEFSNVYSSGYVTALSDIRFKDVIGHTALNLEAIAGASLIQFTWKERDDKTIHVGGIAQEWEKILPEAVVKDADGRLTMDYGVIGMVAAVSLAREMQDQQAKIASLEERIARLESMLGL